MARPGPTTRRFFTTTEIARYCEVSNDGVLKWIKAGKLRAFATPGGHYRISSEDFREFLNRYAFPIQESFFAERPPQHVRRILIVDDEADQREILRRRPRDRDCSFQNPGSVPAGAQFPELDSVTEVVPLDPPRDLPEPSPREPISEA